MLTFKCSFALYFLSWLLVKISFLHDRFASCCFQSPVNTACKWVLKMPRLSNEYGILEVTCKLKWFWYLFFITSVHSITRQLALWVLARSKIQSRLVETGDFVNWIKIFFPKNFAQSPLLPCIHGRLAWLNSPV